MTENEILESLKEATKELNKLDSYFDSIPERESNVDMKLSDLLHYVEFNTLKTNECYRIVREIKKQREIRRVLKNNHQLLTTYKTNLSKLNNESNRKLLLAEMHKKQKIISKSEYKNRIYSDEEIKEILEGVKK